MSESEFDTYLSLVGKLLNLSGRQRRQIADELRDHLEEQFQSLLDQGLPREEALRLAVEDLGDAAALARQFTLPHHIRRRRQLMRYSVTSAAVIVTTFVMAAFYWPANRPEPTVSLQAQDSASPKASAVPGQGDSFGTTSSAPAAPTAASPAAIRDAVMAKLENRDFQLKLDDTPLQDALSFLSDISGVDLLIDQRYLQDIGLDASTPINLKVRQGALSVRTALDLILEQVGGQDLACAVRDGVILISSSDNAYENRVYNCRDLLDGVEVHQRNGLAGQPQSGGGYFQLRAEPLAATLAPAAAGQIGGGEGGVGGFGGGGSGTLSRPATTSPAGLTLINVIEAATAPAEWVGEFGGGGTISEYDGLLIIRHQPRVHQKIEELLTQIRTVRAEDNRAKPRAPAPAKLPANPAGTLPGTGLPTSGDGFNPASGSPFGAPSNMRRQPVDTLPGSSLPSDRDGPLRPQTPAPTQTPAAPEGPPSGAGLPTSRDHLSPAQSSSPFGKSVAAPTRSPAAFLKLYNEEKQRTSDVLTVEATLAIGDAVAESIQPGHVVWLDTVTTTLPDGTTALVRAVTAKIVRVVGTGNEPGTLEVDIAGPTSRIVERQNKNPGQRLRVQLMHARDRYASF
jgi:hypothetical protein